MARNIHDVYLNKPQQGIEPRVLAQMLRGKGAERELGALEGQREIASGLSSTTIPEMRGSTMANPLEFLATAVARRQGKKQLKGIDAQVAALRGEAAGADEATLIAGLQQQDFAQQQKVANIERQFEGQRGMAKEARLGKATAAGLARKATSEEKALDRANRLEIAKLKRGGRGAGRFKGPTAKQQTTLQDTARRASSQTAVIEAFKPEYANTGLPFQGSLENLKSRYASIAATKGEKEQEAWWREYNRQQEIIDRHAMFGSALSKSEKASWAAATINPNMDSEQIEKSLVIRKGLVKKAAEFEVKNADVKGWDRDWIYENYGDVLGQDYFVDRWGDEDELDEMTDEELLAADAALEEKKVP